MRALAERALATSWVLVAAVAVLVCGPVILAGELAAQDSQQRFHRAAIDATADAARGAASEIEARIASVKRDVERVGALDLGPAIRAGDLEAVHSRTVQLLQPGTRAPISPEIANLWISDGAGRPIGIWGHDVFVILRDFSGQSDVIRRSVLVPPDVGSSDFFAIAKRQVAALNTRPFVTRNVRFDPPFSAVGPLVVAPVRDGLELAGIIVAQLKTSEIVKPLLSHTAQVDDLVLFDDAGRQVAQASNPLATYVDLSASTIVQTALRGGTVEGDAPNPLGDGQRVVAVANVADTGWRIAAVMAASVAERDLADSLAQQRIARLALTGLVLIGAVALATAVSEVSRRRRALAHALERQTAVSEVLKIISRSPIQLDAVFEAVIASAVQLCRADNGGIVRIDNGRTHVAAHWGSHHDATAINDYWATHNITADRSTLTGRVLLERRSVAIADVHTEPGYVVRDVPGRDPRPDHSMLGVPLLREGEVVGVMVLRRREVKPFTSAEVAVAETFASQAVIAIENVRLFNETKESLDQQTALSDVLRTISRSAFDLDAVLQTIVERAVALVGGAESAAITRREGDEAIVLAGFGSVLQTLMAHGGRTPVSDKSLIGRALLTGKRQYIADATLDPSLPQDGPRTRLVIPFLRDGRAIGTLGVSHTLPRPFSDREMQMLETFADQAAIAIENVRLFNQTKESLERQTALAEILRVIADSPSDRQPVLEAVARSTTRYCGAEDATVFLVDGNELRRVAHHGPIPIRNETAPLDEQGVAGHAILTRRTIHVADIESAEGDRYPLTRAFAAESGRRGSLAAPLMREGTPIGVILLRKMEPTGFSQSQIQLVEAFADQAMIAIENVRLFNETKEALERQVALGEVLRTMASSPADLGAVLDAIAQNAARFCAAEDCGLALLRADGLLEQVAHFGPLTRELAPWPVDRGSVRGRAIVERRIIQVEDMLAEREEEYPIGLQRAREVGQRTVLAAPLLHEGTPLGAIALRRSSVKPFTDRQIDLLRTFADQAAIAIENVRLFNETKESLERQTALAEILRVIASSPSDQQPVFDAIAANATRYCGAKDAVVLLVQGETLVPVAHHGPIPSPNIIPNPIVRTGVAGRAILDRRTVHVADLTSPAGEEFPLARMRSAEGVGHRGILATPLLREDTAIGAILLRRLEPSGFTPSEIQLVEAFADQAVIAIENVRLFNETKEALERQTATSSILNVISRSPADQQPTLDAIVESGARLCDADMAFIYVVEQGFFKLRAGYKVPTAFVDYTNANPVPVTSHRGSLSGRVVAERRAVQIPDVLADADYTYLEGQQQLVGYRAMLNVPMFSKGELIGLIGLWRTAPTPFTTKQIDLMSTFADQAVIAIENTRLFNETTDALAQQVAVAQVMQAISSSAFNLTPIFDVILKQSIRLCAADAGWVALRVDEEQVKMVAALGRIDDRVKTGDVFRPSQMAQRVLTAHATVHDPTFSATDYWGRTRLGVPLLHEDRVVGVIVLGKDEYGRPFTDRQIQLVETFAKQAVIAIENVRLFNETKEALEQQTAVGDVLKTISRSAFDLQPVLDIVLNNAVRLAGADIGWLSRVENDQFTTVAYSTEFPQAVKDELVRQRAQGHIAGPWIPLGTGGGLMGFTLAEGRTVHLPDVKEDPELKGSIVARLTESRTVVGVPMLRDGRSIGGMVLARYAVRPFSEREIELVQTFADQAAIAIENMRLFNETKEALQRQSAVSEVLKTISGTVFDLDPTLQTVVENAAKLADADVAWMMHSIDSKSYTWGPRYGRTPQNEALFAERPPLFARAFEIDRARGSIVGRVYAEARTIEVSDAADDAELLRMSATVRATKSRSLVGVPVLSEGVVTGAIILGRETVRPFSEREVQLVETFANQAAIAIRNVRLFNEIQDKSRQLEVASRHKSEFLANMSHELRTPLNAIIGFSEVLIQGLFGEVNEKQRDYLQDVIGSGQHLLSLINDILDLSKIEAGRMELELSTFSFRSALQSGVTIVRERAARNGITLNVDVSDELDRVEADERKVKQILYNLLSNAVKFTPDGGNVNVTARRDNGDVRVDVQDNGIGIAEADQARIFEEFQQVGRERSREGTGLGLTLTKRFVELHGGRIWLESAPGKGSRFTFTLPLRQAAPVRA